MWLGIMLTPTKASTTLYRVSHSLAIETYTLFQSIAEREHTVTVVSNQQTTQQVQQ